MPDIPVTTPFEYIGVFLIIMGVIVLLVGLGIIEWTQTIKVHPGKQARSSGAVLITIGLLLLLIPQIIKMLITPGPTPPSTQEPVATTATSQKAYILISTYKNGSNNQFIYRLDEDGKNPIQLTSNPSTDLLPKASPDGANIVFVSDRSGSNGIYLMDADGGNVRVLHDTPNTEYTPAWSPDGKKVAFVSDFAGSQDIYTINIDGTSLLRITNDPANEWSPAWSPDGKKIAFSREGKNDTSNIILVSLDGNSEQQLTKNAGQNQAPCWSPDGSQIVFFSNRQGSADILLMGANGDNQRFIIQSTNNEGYPAWSPDGKWISFIIAEGDLNQLYKMMADGSHLTKLDFSGNATDPAWMIAR